MHNAQRFYNALLPVIRLGLLADFDLFDLEGVNPTYPGNGFP